MASPAAQPSAAPELDDDLRELSSQDAEELRAFQEKRRWFEGKLQLLEAVAPINPFVHPNLSQASLHHGGGGAVYEAAVSTASGERKHDLPKRELLDQWQSERDALEQEVLDFDDGDLGRMKEKTRAVTQVPLTPPSTHLVEITLDLILLIDRLLSLLRARFELLDLTSLRLTWDDLRWTVMLESSKITADLHQAIKGHATWLQSYTVSGSTDTGGTAAEPRATLPSININAFASPPVTSPYTSPTTSPRIGTISSTPTSPSVSRHYRRPSTQLSSLRTALTTLRIRHSTLQSTAVSRAGAIMDQMIDRAGSLKSLAGACGLDMGAGEKKQNETSGDSGADQAGNGGDGAVPDEFLDIQDDLEGGVKALQEELSQGKALEKWFESAERTYTVQHEVQSTSASVIDTLRTAISKPASSSVHDDLHEQLCRAEKTLAHADDIDALPKELRDSFSYIAQQIKGITAGMASTRLSSNKEISAARACLEWYREMTAASSKLDDHRRMLLESTSEIFTLAAGLRDEQQQHRRSLDMDFTPASGEAHSPIDIGEAYRKLEAATAALSDTRKVIAQYQDCITARPTIVIHRLPKPAIGSAVKETEQAAAAMSKAIGEARSAVKAAEAHSNQQDSLLSIRDDLQHYNRTKDDIISDLVTALKSSQWDSTTGIADHSHDAPQALLESAESLLQRCNVATTAWSSLPLDSRNDPAQIPPEWHDSIREIGASVPRVKLLRDLLARSLAQAEAVRAVNTEAEALVSDADDTSSSAECLDRAERWTDSLTSRVAFIDFTSLGEVSADWKSLAGELQASQIGLRSHLNEAALRMRQDPSEPMAAKAAAARAGEDASSVRQDTAIDGFEAAEKEARRSRRQLRGLRLSDIAFPPSTLIARDSQPIPTEESVTVILACINEVRMDSEDDNVFPLEFRSRDIYLKLCDDLGSAQAHIPRLKALAAFDDAVNSCDQAFIAHAEATDDAGQAAEDPNTEARIDDIRMAVREVVQASGAVESDSRVRAEVQRIKSTWYSLAATLGVPSQIDDDRQDGAMSDATSFTSPPTSPLSTSSRHNNRIDPFGGPLPAPAAESRAPTGLRRFPSSASLARFGSTGTRTTSNPFPDRLTQPTASSRNRTVSDVNHLTPTSGAGSASSSTSRARATPRGAATPTRTRVDSLASSVRRMSIASSGGRRASGGSAMGGATHRRVSRLSGLGSSQRKDGDKSVTPKQERRKGPYVPNKRSELDVAIGKIVNDLKVDVPITAAEGRHSSASNATRPVGTANGSHVADDWQDESGRYWIGYEGRAKLCFCRILKSRMVMVRVGGGWMELSRFLLEHFSQMSWAHPSDALAADEAHPGTPSAETEQDTETSQTTDTTGAINSATPADAVYRTTIDPASAASPSPTTPMRPKNLATLTSDQKSSATPGSAATKTPISAGPLTPVRTPGSALPGPTNHHSPGLVPLHFIKKASDSPPVRDKEKERFAGRRSILGKGTPGRVEEL